MAKATLVVVSRIGYKESKLVAAFLKAMSASSIQIRDV